MAHSLSFGSRSRLRLGALMFNHKHYLPILKTKAGERWAIDRIKSGTRPYLTPVFELHKHKTKDGESHAEEICESLSSVWGTEPFYLDTIWLHSEFGDALLIEAVFEAARSRGLNAIPVVRVTYNQSALDVITDIVTLDHRGYMLRLANDHASSHHIITAIVDYIAKPRTEVDLLLDYRNHSMSLQNDVPRLPTLNDWRTFSAASGTFPRSLASLPLHSWSSVPRHDWTTWEAGVAHSTLPRKPAFADYTIRDPGPPADGGEPSANLRYAKDTDWRVNVGGKFKQGFSTDMHTICASLVAMLQVYDGSTFSAGDDFINQVAMHIIGPGAPQQWVQWGMSHHMEFVVNQIQNHPLL